MESSVLLKLVRRPTLLLMLQMEVLKLSISCENEATCVKVWELGGWRSYQSVVRQWDIKALLLYWSSLLGEGTNAVDSNPHHVDWHRDVPIDTIQNFTDANALDHCST